MLVIGNEGLENCRSLNPKKEEYSLSGSDPAICFKLLKMVGFRLASGEPASLRKYRSPQELLVTLLIFIKFRAFKSDCDADSALVLNSAI